MSGQQTLNLGAELSRDHLNLVPALTNPSWLFRRQDFSILLEHSTKAKPRPSDKHLCALMLPSAEALFYLITRSFQSHFSEKAGSHFSPLSYSQLSFKSKVKRMVLEAWPRAQLKEKRTKCLCVCTCMCVYMHACPCVCILRKFILLPSQFQTHSSLRSYKTRRKIVLLKK